MYKVLLSSMSLFGLPLEMIFRKAWKGGFDGVEVFLFNPVEQRVEKARRLAERYELMLHFHEVCSFEEAPSSSDRVLQLLGLSPRKDKSFIDRVPPFIHEPVVVYANHYTEVSSQNHWLQTISMFFENWTCKVGFPDFISGVLKGNLPIVFDTQHYLQYRLGLGKEIPTGVGLVKLLCDGWLCFHGLVKEIHLNDFCVNKGSMMGRNVFLGGGQAPLDEFCKTVRESGWSGTIVPEVSPFHLFPYRGSRLAELRRKVDELLCSH